MTYIMTNNKKYGINSNKAEDIIYDENKSVKDKIDEINSNITASDNLKFRFATDGEGNYGYLKADDSFIPFKGNPTLCKQGTTVSLTKGKYLIFVSSYEDCWMASMTLNSITLSNCTILTKSNFYNVKPRSYSGGYCGMVAQSFIIEVTSTKTVTATVNSSKGSTNAYSSLYIIAYEI